MMEAEKASGELNLYLFTGLNQDPVLRDLLRFRDSGDTSACFRAVRGLLDFSAHSLGSTDLLREYVVDCMLDTPGIGRLMERPGQLEDYLNHDVRVIRERFFAFRWNAFCLEQGILPLPGQEKREDCPEWLNRLVSADSDEKLAAAVQDFFTHYHDRDEARYLAFRWKDGRLEGIRRVERFTFDHLAGLEHQKESLVRNAQAFVEGRPAHNVLLVGGSGTGKSSCVRATLSAFADQGLRLVELPKQKAGQLPALLEALTHRRCRYIVYIDDLSFEEVDEGYKELKVALDGQVEAKLPHVLIYVTSNRRHLVRETWKDRDVEGEIHENDTLHEKMSLSERFGLHVYFSVYSQKEYFQVVSFLLAGHGISLTDEIRTQAAAWALTYNGRSGRTARQFVSDYISRLG